jgi:hypothetical protein
MWNCMQSHEERYLVMEEKLDSAIVKINGIVGFLNLPREGTPHLSQPSAREVILSRSQVVKEKGAWTKQ